MENLKSNEEEMATTLNNPITVFKSEKNEKEDLIL